MAKELKTRFYARIRGGDRILFSVMETSDKGLTITSRTPKFWENSDGSFVEFQQQHYSVHPTNGNVDTTITQKTQLRDGTHHSNVTFIPGTQEHLLWPVFARLYPEFKSDIGIVKPRLRDAYIKVGEYDPEKATLLYSIFVCRPWYDTKVLEENNIDFYSATFDNFKVIVIPAYMNLPSLSSGDVVGMTSSTPVVNHKKSDEHVQFNVRSLPPESIVIRHWFLLGLLRDKFYHRWNALLTERIDVDSALFHFMPQPGIEELDSMVGWFENQTL